MTATALTAIGVSDPEAFWTAAGFTVESGRIALEGLHLVLDGDGDGGAGGGITGWSFEPAPDGDDVDGLRLLDAESPASHAPGHPNGTTALDHVVVMTGDLDRTTEALGALGIEARRTRDTEMAGRPVRQRFFRPGATIIELVGPLEPTPRPASFWGLAFTTPDLDALADLLGPAVSHPRDAVQPGRRIATLRHKDLGGTVPVAFMSPHRPGR